MTQEAPAAPAPVADPAQQALLDSVELAPEAVKPEPEPTEPVAEAAPDEPAEEAPAGEAPAPLPENWHEREEVQTRLKDSHAEGWRKGFSKADLAAKARIDALTQHGQVYDGLQDLIKAVEKAAEEGGLLVDDDKARRGLADLLSRSEVLANAVKMSEGHLESRGQGTVVEAFMGLATSTLPKESQEPMSAFVSRLIEDTKVGIAESEDFWPALFRKRDELATKAAFEKGRKAGIEAERKANGKAVAAETRTGLKGPEAPGGHGGALTTEQYKQKLARGEQVSPEEVDAMTARFAS